MHHCVQSQLRSFGKLGSGPGEFDEPSGIAVDEGNVLVCDTGNNRIQKFTADGHFITAVGTKGSKPLQFRGPNGIAFNTSNKKVYIADLANHRIQVLNSDLTHLGGFQDFYTF